MVEQLRRQSAKRETQVTMAAFLLTNGHFVIVCTVQTDGTLAMQAEQS